MNRFARIAAVGLALLLAACGTAGNTTFPDGGTASTPAITTADKVAQARQVLSNVKLGVTVAEIAFDGVCASSAAPKFCTDPAAQAAYADAKVLVAGALQTADDALATNGTFTDADIAKLVGDATTDLAYLEAVISDVRAGKAPPLPPAASP